MAEVNYSGKYDVFLSYRRDGGDMAALALHSMLTAKGFRVFLDVDNLRGGRFNEKLLEVIANCTDFVLVCSPGCFDRCKNEEDWVRQEIDCALERGKNIIPVMLRNFDWPEPMPVPEWQGIALNNGIHASDNKHFIMAIDLLCEKRLESKPKRKQQYNPERAFELRLFDEARLVWKEAIQIDRSDYQSQFGLVRCRMAKNPEAIITKTDKNYACALLYAPIDVAEKYMAQVEEHNAKARPLNRQLTPLILFLILSIYGALGLIVASFLLIAFGPFIFGIICGVLAIGVVLLAIKFGIKYDNMRKNGLPTDQDKNS